MAIQLTPEQEQRIRAVVDAGMYPSPEDAIEAALEVVESAAGPAFDATEDELEALLLEGLNSGEAVEADDVYWNGLRTATDRIAAEHRERKPIR